MPEIRKSELKIYLVVGLGYVVGEPLHDWKNKIVLKNAGVVRGDTKKISITPPVVHWFAHQMDKIQRFEIHKHLIIDEDNPAPDVLKVYDIYVKKINEQVSGIKISNKQEMDRVINLTKKFTTP